MSVDYRLVPPVPEGTGWTGAASIMVSFMTAHDALVSHGHLSAGDSVLVQGCTSGVGIAASQIAAYLRSARVIGTSTTASKLAEMRAWRVDEPVNVREQSVVESVL